MSINKFKTIRHIETVRNIIGVVIKNLIDRCSTHDQSKLQPPEIDVFEEYTPKLRDLTYGSEEYKQALTGMKPALDHHYTYNRHHPEHFKKYVCNGCFKEYISCPNSCDVCGYSSFQIEADISQMNLLDVLEMLCDWKAATLRHNDGDIMKSIKINKERFGISDQLTSILENTATWLEDQNYYNKANES